jgi:hypothetical protein
MCRIPLGTFRKRCLQDAIDRQRQGTQSDPVRTHLTLLFLLTFILACSGSSGGGGTPPPVDGAAGAGGIDSGTGADTGPPAATYQKVKPLFVAKCTPCHSAGGIGASFHTLADSYDTANKPADSGGACPGKKIGECTLVMVKMGFMPFGKMCTGDPSKDAANTACLTAPEQKLLEDWIAGGLREK